MDWLVDARTNLDVAGIEANLPGIRGGNHNIPADEFAPVHVISECSRKQPNAVAALAEDLIGLLEHRDTRPLEVSRVDGDIVFLHQHFQPVIQTAHHDGADRPHGIDFLAFPLPPLQASLHGFRHGDTLGHRERNGRIDADAAVCGFLNGWNASSGHGDFDNHVGRQAAELHHLVQDGI